MQTTLLGILSLACIAVVVMSAIKLVAEHGADNTRGGRSFLHDLGYSLFVPAACFLVGATVIYIPQIRAAFGI